MKIGVKFRLSVVILAVVMLAMACSNPASGGGGGREEEVGGPSVITEDTILGITIPEKGETPVTDITENEQYSGTVAWSTNQYADDVDMITFAAATVYTATITLTPKSGYTLEGVEADFFKVNGAVSVNNDVNSGIITAVFPSTDAHVITIAAIQGVTAPVNGGVPVTTITANDQYSGTVTWLPSVLTFAAVTQYTATITLTPKTSYTLQGVTDNFFTVVGATSVSNAVNSGVITAVFPQTAATVITSVNISITAPVKSMAPGATASTSGTVNFSIGAVSWSPNNNPFLGNTEYKASVTLTAHSGYTFTGLTTPTINGQTATVSDNTGSAVTLSYTFPKTDEKAVSGIAIKTQPAKLTYTHGDTLDLTGLVLTLTHDDTTAEDIAAASFAAKNITANPATGNSLIYSTHNEQPVKITYGSLTCNTNTLTVNRVTPAVGDYTISGIGTFTYNGNVRVVTVTPKEGKSAGTRTVKYNGSTTAPSTAGTYTVTFDVAVAGDFSAVSGLSAGTLTIEKATPTAADYTISGLTQTYDGNSKTVTIMVKTGKSDGAMTVKYNSNTTAPSAAGTYTITFDVAEVTNFNAASGLFAGMLTIEKATPTAADYNISGTGSFTYDSYPKTVTITPKEGKSNGTITVKYNGSTTAPSAVDEYAVTFDVAIETNFNAANGFPAGYLTITVPTFTSITALETYLQSIPANTADSPYIIVLNVNNLSGIATISGSLGYVLRTNNNKYVSLNLSGSTFTGNKIVANAFNGCTSLIGISIPNSVTSIENTAFNGCNNLRNITIKTDKVTNNSSNNWGNRFPATNLVVTFEDVTSIGYSAFENCTRLTSVTIPNNVTNIGIHAFSGCTGLTSVTIPNSVTSIGTGAFSGCTGLTSVTIGSGVTSIGEEAFRYCTSLTNITIPNNVKSIGNSAFKECRNLTSITIPNSVTSIGQGAFYYCTGLTSVTIGSGVTSIGQSAFNYCTSLTSITIPNSVTSIGSFSYCTSLASVTLPTNASFTSIGSEAFLGCANLTNITIPNSVKSIGDGAFTGCTSLTNITIPNSVTSIGFGAFANCTSFTNITIPNSVTSIGEMAFLSSIGGGLTAINVDINNSAYTAENGVLYNKNKTVLHTYPVGKTDTSFTIPNSVKSIVDYAFSHCRSLTSITIPNSVTSIGTYTFDYCTSLTSVTIPNGVTSIRNYTFHDCTSLTSVTIPNSVTSIEESAFSDCTSLTSITIPNNITSIEARAFSYCTSLTSITIPNSVTSIGNEAFYYCTSLVSVTFQGLIPFLHEYAFSSMLSDSTGSLGNLRNMYFTGGIGTYTRTSSRSDWTKQ